MNKTEQVQLHTMAQQIIEGLDATINDWDNLYDLIGSAWLTTRDFALSDNSALEDNLSFAAALTAVTMISAYISFRKAQPSMNDFELAKRHIIQEASNFIHEAIDETFKRTANEPEQETTVLHS